MTPTTSPNHASNAINRPQPGGSIRSTGRLRPGEPPPRGKRTTSGSASSCQLLLLGWFTTPLASLLGFSGGLMRTGSFKLDRVSSLAPGSGEEAKNAGL